MTTTSHFQLLSPDLLAHIVSFLNPIEETSYNRGRSGDRRGLLSLAETCKSLSTPALDRLWEQIPNLVPLVCSMPGDLWTLEELPSSHRRAEKHIIKFVRPPVPADYMRFITYALRVKCLSNDLTVQYPRMKAIRTHPEVLSTLDSFRPSVHLLSQIKDLSLDVTKHTVGPVRILLSPKLEKLRFVTHTTHDEVIKAAIKQATIQLFQKLGRVCPQLTQLTLDCSIRSRELRHELADALQNLPSLMLFILKESSVDMPILRVLSMLPNLRVLVIDYIVGDAEWEDELLRRPYLSFDSLCMLNLNTDNLTFAYNLVCSIMSGSLQAVCLDVYSPASRSLVRKTLAQLANHHLRHLKFVLPCADSDPPQEVLTSDTLCPLLKVKEFITLDLHACPIDFDHHFLLDCADSWPNITTLRLGVRHGPGEPYSSVSLPALVPFVHRCPTLKFLGLPLDTTPATFVRDLRNVPPSLCGGHPQHRLQALQVGQAAITDVSMVSGFLSGLFPNLLCVDGTCSEDDFDEDEEDGGEEEARALNAGRWEDVEEEIPHFVAVRRQERAWAKAHGQRVVRRGKTIKGGAWDAFGLRSQALDMAEHRERQRFRHVVAGVGGWQALRQTGP